MVKKIIFLFVSAIVIIACSKNQISGRQQLKLIPEKELQGMAATQYQQFLSSNKVVNNTINKDAEMVRRVGERISRSVEEYLKANGKENLLEGYKWEYNLVDDKAANAWCMPGGKIVVYTGLLPITQNEAALAAVMGHEVSHAILQHGNERMSQQIGYSVIGMGLQVALSNKPAETQNAFLTAYGVGAQAGVLLPFSRKHELEADRYGLIWTAMSGYNPQEAIALWERMEKASNGQNPPEFLSTHPSEQRRIAQLKKYMPEAMTYYKPVKGGK